MQISEMHYLIVIMKKQILKKLGIIINRRKSLNTTKEIFPMP